MSVTSALDCEGLRALFANATGIVKTEVDSVNHGAENAGSKHSRKNAT